MEKLINETTIEIINTLRNKNHKQYVMAMSAFMIKTYIPIPYNDAVKLRSLKLPIGYYDDIDENGNKIYFGKLLGDIYRSHIINKLFGQISDIELTRYAIKRIEKNINDNI